MALPEALLECSALRATLITLPPTDSHTDPPSGCFIPEVELVPGTVCVEGVVTSLCLPPQLWGTPSPCGLQSPSVVNAVLGCETHHEEKFARHLILVWKLLRGQQQLLT